MRDLDALIVNEHIRRLQQQAEEERLLQEAIVRQESINDHKRKPRKHK